MTGALEQLSANVQVILETLATRQPRPWLDVQGAADYLAMSKDAIATMAKRRSHGLPVHRAPNGRLLFRPEELDDWARGQRP